MSQEQGPQTGFQTFRGKMPVRLREVIHQILSLANRSYSRIEFVRQVCTPLVDYTGCDVLTIRIDGGGKVFRCRAEVVQHGAGGGRIRIHCSEASLQEDSLDATVADLIPEPVFESIHAGSFAAAPASFTRGGSFWTGDTARPMLLHGFQAGNRSDRTVVIGGEFQSLALIPVPLNDKSRGALMLGSRRRDFFGADEIQAYEAVAESLGAALGHQRAQWAMRERVKELTCLYGIGEVARLPGIGIDELLRRIVALLPPAWQYPDIACARIVFGGRAFVTEAFRESACRQSAYIQIEGQVRGTVEVFYSEKMPDFDEGPFLQEERSLINAVAELLGVILAHHSAQLALRERVKELTCLYGIAQVASRSNQSLDQLLQAVVELLPPGWQHPALTQARITLDGRAFVTSGFRESPFEQSSDILINGTSRGAVQVYYTEKVREMDEGPFLKEERSLIDEVARQVGLVVEHSETEEEKGRLQEQLRHAERLATVGQLSAGVAHELNEPLVAVLGFAELIQQCPGVPPQAASDTEKIVSAALHAREVIRKLMIFTKQVPTRKEMCDLNEIVAKGIYLLESRCSKEGITLVRRMQKGLPKIEADPSQLHQVLVNLVVNAIQAMPGGGTLTIWTRHEADRVALIVEDTGTGMSPEIQKKMFLPFFTTKDVNKGTGLGLSVVHGIVTAHGGTVCVNSEVGKGSSIEVWLPVAGPPLT